MTKLTVKRDRLFAEYERGATTGTEVRLKFIALMLEASDDSVAISLCNSLPHWFREEFKRYLRENEDSGYEHRWVSSNEIRSREQIQADAKKYGDFLARLGPRILETI